MDVSGAAPVFQVLNIVTPFGMLRDTVPIPGAVIQGMSESITSLMNNFKPTILVGPPTSLTFSVDEGRGFSEGQNVSLTNTGVYGSLLSTDLSTSATYIYVSPSVVGNLATNVTGSFEVQVDSTDLLSSSSPYTGTISIQDDSATNSPRTLPLTIVVRPKAIIDTTLDTVSFTVTRPISGPFPPISSEQFAVQNTGPSGSVLDFQIVRLTGLSQNWLSSFTPVYGTLNNGQQQTISVYVDPVDGLMPGTYEETLRVSGYSFNNYVDVLVQLVIT